MEYNFKGLNLAKLRKDISEALNIKSFNLTNESRSISIKIKRFLLNTDLKIIQGYNAEDYGLLVEWIFVSDYEISSYLTTVAIVQSEINLNNLTVEITDSEFDEIYENESSKIREEKTSISLEECAEKLDNYFKQLMAEQTSCQVI